jgi:hypothetical protein
MRLGTSHGSSAPGARRTLVGIGVLVVAIGGPPVASAATLQLSIKADQAISASAVTVKATGTADSPSSCASGTGCELSVFVIRGGSCPADATPLLGDNNLVTFETAQGLPALVGTRPGPFSVTGTYFLNGAPNGAGQAKATEGYTESPWGTFIFCGYLQDAVAVATLTNRRPDELAVSGPGDVHLPQSKIELYSVSCAAPPCRIKLSERAFVRGKHIAGLDRQNLKPIAEGGGEAYTVSFAQSGLRQALLRRTIARYGALELRFAATMTDAAGGRTTATRTIALHAGHGETTSIAEAIAALNHPRPAPERTAASVSGKLGPIAQVPLTAGPFWRFQKTLPAAGFAAGGPPAAKRYIDRACRAIAASLRK